VNDEVPIQDDQRRGWLRATALLGVVLATSIVQPTVLLAIPLLVLIGLQGIRSGAVFLVTVLGMLAILAGARDALWFVERAWALVVGGLFAALSIGLPRWRLTSRAMTSIAGATAVSAALLGLRKDAWASIDWQVSDRLRASFSTWLDAMAVLRDGEAASPALVSAIYQTLEAQVHVFPALVAVETMAALALVWWIYMRLVHRADGAVGSVESFRFNDHLVWLIIAGLAMMAWRSDGAVTRVGANLVVFMGSLYALRGFGVVVFVNGGLSFIGITLFVLGILLAAPVVLGFSVLLGIADTWLDLRARASSQAA
jgi:hypothetical protein